MDLVRHLRYFLVVGEELHVGHAADRLGIAQPALSQRIRRLEQELEARLFDRTSHGVVLTPAGEVLKDEAEQLLDRFDRVRSRVALAAHGELGSIRVGLPPLLAGRALARVLDGFADQRPGVRVELHDGLAAEQQLRMLTRHELHAALLHLPVDGAGLVVGPKVRLPVGVVLVRESALAQQTELGLDDLAGRGLVLPTRDQAPGLYDTTLAACRAQGFDPAPIRHAANAELMLALVLAGDGVAFAPGDLAQKEARVVWRPLRGPGLTWQVAVVWSAEQSHPAAPALAEVVAATLDDVRRPEERPPGASDANDRHGPWTVANWALHAKNPSVERY